MFDKELFKKEMEEKVKTAVSVVIESKVREKMYDDEVEEEEHDDEDLEEMESGEDEDDMDDEEEIEEKDCSKKEGYKSKK